MKFLTPLIFLLIALGIFIWVINPVYKDIGVLRSDGNQYQMALARAEEAVSKRNELVTRYNNFSDADLQRLQKLLPDNVDNIRLVVDLNSIAAKYGTGIKNIKITENSPAGSRDAAADIKPYGSLSMTFGVSLSYDNFLRFLTDLQQNLRLTDVTAVDFTAASAGIYDYSITLKTYVMR